MSEGFFSKKEVESQSRPDGKVYSCISCGNYKNAITKKMVPYGNFKKGILNVGEYPEELDDSRGLPFQSKGGRLLKRTYEKYGIDLVDDCLNINVIRCRPLTDDGEERLPTNFEIDCCRRFILKEIKERKPKIIMVFGMLAVYSLIGHRFKKSLEGITKWRGWTIPDQDFQAWLCPIFSPSQLLKDDENVAQIIFEQDIKNALIKLNEPFREYKEPTIHYVKNLNVLTTITSDIAFDYETTGLKPHLTEHKIICASVAYEDDKVYAFMMPDEKRRQPFINLLENPYIGKIAHNMKYEHTWSINKLNTEVQNWKWDTMQMAHILDNRPGITGLKFQTYVQFGIIDYSSEIEPFLNGIDNKNANSLNRIEELIKTEEGKQKLMRYCALDSIFEFRLAKLQQDEIFNVFH